jgi:WD40 repeat protein
MLPLGSNDLPMAQGSGSKPEDRLRFDQVLMPSSGDVIASAVAPQLFVWTQRNEVDWQVQRKRLPGDIIPGGRAIATNPSGSLLAVEVRSGRDAKILLCRRSAKYAETICSAENAASTPLLVKIDDGCRWSSDDKMAIAMSKSGRLIAAGVGTCPIEVFDTQEVKAPRRYIGHKGNISSLHFSPDETTFISTSDKAEVLLWNLADTSPKNINHHGSTPYVSAAKYSPSGRWIISTAWDNKIIVSSAKDGKELVELEYRYSLFALDVAPTPRGTLMATGSEAGDVNVARFFEDSTDLEVFTTSVLKYISE